MIFSYCRNIYLSNTDAAGVLYFAEGMSICHEAYEEWLDSKGISLQKVLQEKKIALPIVRGEIDFFKPIVCGDKLEIQLDLLAIKNSSFAIAYKLFNLSSSNKLSAKALTKHVCIDPQTRQRINLPLEIVNE